MNLVISKKIQLLLISFLTIANVPTAMAAANSSPCQFMTEKDDQKALAYFIYKDIMGQPGELAGFNSIDLTAHESAWIIMMTTWAFHKKNKSITSFKKIWAANNCLKIYISCFESPRLFEIACRTIYAQLRPAVFSNVEHFLLKKEITYSTDYFLFGLFLMRINREYASATKRTMLKNITEPLLDCFFKDERIQNKVATIMQEIEEKN